MTLTMCISEDKSYIPSPYFYDNEGGKTSFKNSIKILGIHFSSSHNMSAQVAAIQASFRSCLWVLTHLFQNGMSKAVLLAL